MNEPSIPLCRECHELLGEDLTCDNPDCRHCVEPEEIRIVVHFSCGAASAVAAKLSIAKYGHDRVILLNAFIREEHSDNRRFLADCERWLDHPVTVIQSKKFFASTHEVWRRERYIKGLYGASCSRALKRDLLAQFARPDDIHVLGFTRDEQGRVDSFIDANNGISAEFPLVEASLTKADCLGLIKRAGVELPMMYRLGFSNANCIGCCKGGLGYWNRIKTHFPEQFYQIADIQEAIGDGAYFLKHPDTKARMKLRDLPEDRGTHEEPEISCSFFCLMAEQDFGGAS